MSYFYIFTLRFNGPRGGVIGGLKIKGAKKREGSWFIKINR